MAASVALLGCGAMAQLYAGLLQQQGITPLLLARPLTSTQQLSLTLELLDGNALQHTVTIQPSDMPAAVDAILVFTKAQQCLDAVAPLLSWLPNSTPIVLLHNGMGPQHQLAAQQPAHNIWVGSVSDGAQRLGQYRVAQRGLGTRVAGQLEQSTPALPSCLQALEFSQSDDITTVLWRKLSVNAVINPLCGRDRVANGALLAPKYQQEIAALCNEIVQLGQYLGMHESAAACQQRILAIATATAANRCSTLQDLDAERPTELPAISGYLLQQAQYFKLELHHHQRLYKQLTLLESVS
ncbi:ketopantoate reductase family protein [Ferrimonas lipolytica]|uniref:2-dehydropantoate 2-reductase n=1 Tax=Ferrimonas lipolytica TaxID=2724191 RepID=A0A6H1UAC6_9GAMM|nr:2-dehydropantoate 2-reductase [Ferrimonas lipolytica]QIZ75589.1 2-dehydropantoate 2-reductase [Ferrimonas lipolytica]